VTDLDSKNGTSVNGVAVVDAFLEGGETVRVGSTHLRIERAPGSEAVPLPDGTRFGRFLGASVEVRRLYSLCERLAMSTVPLVIEGETGTGKEVLAESIHERGPRAAGPFVVFDCTAVPPSLVESELFGHERGAFTGAVGTRKGVFEQADGGTLLIDEIGDLDVNMQPKLLRALERSEVRRVGGAKWIRVDVRVLAATRRDLDREVQRGHFRDDLFHRIAVTRIELPPLRKRRGDVALLARHFAQALGGDPNALPTEWVVRWEDYAWPGNVRELRNAVARQLALGELAPTREERDAASVADAPLSRPVRPASGRPGDFLDEILALALPLIPARQRVVDEFERRYVESVLAAHGGNMVRASAASGIARRHFQRIKARAKKDE
jgi:two-component system response regulator HydG